MQKSFFRAKQPGQSRHKERVRRKRCRAIARDIKRRSPSQTCVCDGLPKNGGDLLSQLVGQYHRRG